MDDKEREEGWRLELQPTLIELANNLRKSPPSDRPFAVPVGEGRITITPAEREVLVRAAERGGAGVPRHYLLVSDGLVLRFRLLEALTELDRAPEEARPQAAARARHDVEIGTHLVRAMQGEMAVLMSTGKVDHGRRLAEHRGFLSEALQGAQRHLADAGFEPAAPATAAPESGGVGPGPASERRRGAGRQMPGWAPQVVAGLLLLLLAALLVQLWSARPKDLPAVTVNDFSFLPGVEAVACRPPGVILVIPGDRWIRLSAAGRRQALANAVQVVEHLGYRRLQLRSPSGSVLAEWNKGGRTSVPD